MHPIAINYKKSLEHFLPPDVKPRCSFIQQAAAEFPVRRLCEALHLSPVSYYRSLSRSEPTETSLTQAVREVFWRHSRRYGSRRMQAELQAEGHPIGRHRVRRLMREQGLRAIQPRSFVPRTTQAKHGAVLQKIF
jgi:hypothetical protein